MKRLCQALAFSCALPVAASAETPTPIPRATYDVLTTVYQYDRDVPLGVQTVRRDENPLYVREKLVFRSVRDGLVTGYFAVPRHGPGPFPLVLLLHSLTGSKEDWWQLGNYTSGGDVTHALLRAGYAAAMLDMQYHWRASRLRRRRGARPDGPGQQLVEPVSRDDRAECS